MPWVFRALIASQLQDAGVSTLQRILVVYGLLQMLVSISILKKQLKTLSVCLLLANSFAVFSDILVDKASIEQRQTLQSEQADLTNIIQVAGGKFGMLFYSLFLVLARFAQGIGEKSLALTTLTGGIETLVVSQWIGRQTVNESHQADITSYQAIFSSQEEKGMHVPSYPSNSHDTLPGPVSLNWHDGRFAEGQNEQRHCIVPTTISQREYKANRESKELLKSILFSKVSNDTSISNKGGNISKPIGGDAKTKSGASAAIIEHMRRNIALYLLALSYRTGEVGALSFQHYAASLFLYLSTSFACSLSFSLTY